MTTKSLMKTKIGGDIVFPKAFIIRKTEQSSYFSCKTDVLWVCPVYEIGAIC